MIRKKVYDKEIIIDLTGPEGNAFYLLGYADSLAKRLGYSEERKQQLMNDMKAGDYENLLKVFDAHFGHFVILER